MEEQVVLRSLPAPSPSPAGCSLLSGGPVLALAGTEGSPGGRLWGAAWMPAFLTFSLPLTPVGASILFPSWVGGSPLKAEWRRNHRRTAPTKGTILELGVRGIPSLLGPISPPWGGFPPTWIRFWALALQVGYFLCQGPRRVPGHASSSSAVSPQGDPCRSQQFPWGKAPLPPQLPRWRVWDPTASVLAAEPDRFSSTCVLRICRAGRARPGPTEVQDGGRCARSQDKFTSPSLPPPPLGDWPPPHPPSSPPSPASPPPSSPHPTPPPQPPLDFWEPRGRGGRRGQPCAPRLSTEKAARCFRSSSRIFSSSESGSSGLLYSSSSFSEAARSPPEARGVEDEGSRALFFRHLVLRFWNHTWEEKGPEDHAGTQRAQGPFGEGGSTRWQVSP